MAKWGTVIRVAGKPIWLRAAAAGGLAALLAGALAAVPPEATLGARIRLVYAHAGAIWTGLILYLAAAALALVALRRPDRLPWAVAADLVGTSFLVLGNVLALFSMKLIWGGLFLAEPRFLTNVKILVMALAAHAVSWASESAGVRVPVIAGKTAVAFWWVLTTELVMHPDRPVLRGDPAMLLAFVGVTGAYLAAALVSVAAIRRHVP